MKLSDDQSKGITIELPWPPSLNAYYLPTKGRMVIRAEGKQYRERIRSIIRGISGISGRVEFDMEFYPPDNRRRDLDNLFKCLFDALKYGLIGDDSNIKIVHAKMLAPYPPSGMVYLEIIPIKPHRKETTT